MSNWRSEQEVEEIQEPSHFNFIKIHLLSHFWQHVERFRNIVKYSTDISELAQKEHIKESDKSSDTVDTALQILVISIKGQVFQLRLLNLTRLYYNTSSHTVTSAIAHPCS